MRICAVCEDFAEPGWQGGIECCGEWYCSEECWTEHDQLDGHPA